MMKLLKKSDYQTMAWKNGMGSTAQIAIHPPNADFTNGQFLWRISSATVQAPGPFSQFPGFDRWLVVLSGKGLLLNGMPLLTLKPFHFSGDEKIHSEILQDSVVDFGIIYRRDQVQATMIASEIVATQTLELTQGKHFIYCVQGGINAAGIIMQTGDTLEIHASLRLDLSAVENKMAKYIHLQLSES